MSEDSFFSLSEDSTWNACMGQLGDLEALFYVGRGDLLPERFEERAAAYLETRGDDPELRARRMSDTTNLLTCLGRGTRRARRLAHAVQLSARPVEKTETQGDANLKVTG